MTLVAPQALLLLFPLGLFLFLTARISGPPMWLRVAIVSLLTLALARPEFRDDLRALRDSTIGPLLQDEERNRADLLQTLEAFFQCHGNHTQTAEQLSVHRNTLFYRMNRIQEITRLDLNRPDVRLAVHLALKIHRLLTVET
jgi:DNA-binding PucR family transcriptional regulator